MYTLNAALLVNLLGFSVGIALYAMLGAMVVRRRRDRRWEHVHVLLLTTALLGLLWNLGELFTFVRRDFVEGDVSPWITALAFSALGFLPSVVVHSAQADESGVHWLTYAAYALSILATVLHFTAALTGGETPSGLALQAQTIGSLALACGLLLFNLRQTLEKKALWAAALLVFAVSALHLSGERESSWYVELIAHQASLPLALIILFQNYRFAFADLFLKRAISLLLLAGVAVGLYVAAQPLLRLHDAHEQTDVQEVAILLTLWIVTALAYPPLHSIAEWIVDKAILKRSDYGTMQRELAGKIESIDAVEDILDAVCLALAAALTAGSAGWKESEPTADAVRHASVDFTPDEASITIPTAESPQYSVHLTEFAGGRRLLSDEVSMLEAVSLLAARQIDVLRVTGERHEQRFREQEFAKLAAEAQLTALRSQVNPHFLFNALTTIGYLIKTSPDKAYTTLLTLTQLLRGVLRQAGEFSTLGDEMKLIESYLEIERARFEERLAVEIDVPEELRVERVPTLILQPVVENAIKHAISENKAGGRIRIAAEIRNGGKGRSLHLSVWDSGAGAGAKASKGLGGVGLRNVRERLASYYGDGASLRLDRSAGAGTDAVIDLPLKVEN